MLNGKAQQGELRGFIAGSLFVLVLAVVAVNIFLVFREPQEMSAETKKSLVKRVTDESSGVSEIQKKEVVNSSSAVVVFNADLNKISQQLQKKLEEEKAKQQ